MREQFSYNEHFLMRDGVPWFPVMGEMHYSRFKEDFWEESLRKMKAGGVTVVSTYAIWIHHEEERGVFDFSGCRNLKRFLELCRKVGLYAFLRLGPWVHGEVRNGGFPDWLMKLGQEGVALRSDDETYLRLVRNYWEQIYGQVADFLRESRERLLVFRSRMSMAMWVACRERQGKNTCAPCRLWPGKLAFKCLFTLPPAGAAPVSGTVCQ